MNRAYSLLEVKSVDSEKRVITGIATTPEPDRMGDIVVPTGVTYAASIPLLLHHDKERPVGRVSFKTPTSKGINFEASLPFIAEAGALKDRVDEAWSSVKAGLITGVSIGFRVLDDAIEQIKATGGLKFLKTEVMELSLVTIPANASATILTVKSLDTKDLAASGLNTSGVTDTPTLRRKDAPTMTIPEQITQFENKRAANQARMTEIQTKASSEGRTKDDAEREEYQTLRAEVSSVDCELQDLRDQEKYNLAHATAITSTTKAATASDLRGGVTATHMPRVTVASHVPPGISFTRSVMALAACQGNRYEAAEYAKQRWDSSTPEVATYLKSAIAAGTTTDSTFAAPLAVTNPLTNEFIELLRPKTLLGRIPNLRRVPFNVSVPTQTAGGTYAWVGQGKQKPLTNMATATTTLLHNKIAGIIVLTMELVKLSSPSAEALVRDEMIAGIVKFMDEQFLDPTVAASGTVTPASITNGTTAVTSSGTSNDNARTDLKAVMATFVAANLSTANSVWVMSEANKFALEMAVNALGAPLFPGVSNGMLFGRPIIDTQSAANVVALVDAQGILVADEGGVTIDVSRDASLQMDSAPTDPPDASSVFVNLFQANLIALRAERMVTYKRARTASVKYVSAAYV